MKYSERQQRNFDEAKMKAGQCVIGLQVGCCQPPVPRITAGGFLCQPL